MSIRFGWTRPQAGPETTDDDHVEDVSSAPSDFAAHAETGAAADLDPARQRMLGDRRRSGHRRPGTTPPRTTPATPRPRPR